MTSFDSRDRLPRHWLLHLMVNPHRASVAVLALSLTSVATSIGMHCDTRKWRGGSISIRHPSINDDADAATAADSQKCSMNLI